MEKRNIIAVFDFDGTITRKESFSDFIKFCFGSIRSFLGQLTILPILAASKMGTISDEATRQEIFYHFFAQKDQDFFTEKCNLYKERIVEIVRQEALDKIKWHQKRGDKVIIISSSIADWINPWALSVGIKEVYATTPEVDADKITGRLSKANYSGQEKADMLLSIYPDRKSYDLYVYGKGNGYKELLAIADFPFPKTF